MKIERIKEVLIYLCVFFLPYTTFRIMGLKLSEILMCLICFLSMFTTFKNNGMKIKIKNAPHVKFFFGFSIAIILSMCINFLDETYLEKNGINNGVYYSYEYGWMFKIIRLLLVICFTSILINFFKESKKNIKRISNAYVISTLIIDIYALIKLGTKILHIKFGITRTSLMAVEPSEAGFINAVSIIIVIYEIIINKEFNIKNIVSLLILFITQIYIGSAAALAFLPISILLIMFYRTKKDKKFRKYTLLLCIILISGFYYLVTQTNIFNKVINYKQLQDVQGSSSVERIAAIQTGIVMFKEKPILGFGWGNFGWFVEKYKTTTLYNTVGGGSFSANNQYIVILSELGIIGSTIFICFISQILKYIRHINKTKLDKESNMYFYIFLTLFAYVMLSNFTLNAIYSYQLWISISVIIYLYYNSVTVKK